MQRLKCAPRAGLALIAIFTLTVAAPVAADDWPQFRGENRDGISPETGLLGEWPETGPGERPSRLGEPSPGRFP